MTDDLMDIYREIAARFGIDSGSDEAVRKFFRDDLLKLDERTREEVSEEIVQRTTGLQLLGRRAEWKEQQSQGDPWMTGLLEVADGNVELEMWEGSILRYMRECVAPRVPEIDRLELSQDMALDELFSDVQPDSRWSDYSRAIRIVPWAREHQSPAVVDAFVRFLAQTNAILSSAGSADELANAVPAQELRRIVMQNIRFLDSILREYARADTGNLRKRLYQDLIDVLRAAADGPCQDFTILRELAVLERHGTSRARRIRALVLTAAGREQLSDVEDRLGFEGFYNAVRLALDQITLQMSSDSDVADYGLIGWLRDFINDRSEVIARDEEVARSGGNPRNTLRSFWMELQEGLYSEAKFKEFIESVVA